MSAAAATDERFALETRTLMKERIGVAAWVGAFIFPIYVFEDQWLCPDDWQRVFALRLLCSLSCILAVAVNHTGWARRNTFAFMVLIMAGISSLKAFTTALAVTDIQALYFGGHALILCGTLAYLPLKGWQALVLGGTCVLAYAATTLAFASPVDHIPFQIQVGLLSAIWLQLTIGCHLDYRTREREFAFRTKLHQVRRRAEDYGF